MPQHLVASLFHVSTKTLKRWQDERAFPKPFYIGAMPYYRAVDVRLWQESQTKNTQEPPRPKK